MWCLPYRVGRLTLKAKRFHTNDHASHQYQDDVKPLLTLVMDCRTGRNRNFEEESGFGEKIMREFPYAEIFLLYLAVRLLWPPLSLPNNQEV